MSQQSFAEFFASLSDDELVRRSKPGTLVQEAEAAAHQELRSRGLPIPNAQLATEFEVGSVSTASAAPRVVLERNLSPQEAQVRAAFLRMMGIDADEGDVNTIQAQGLLAIALGGASIRVPEDARDESINLLKAFDAGEFALPDDWQDAS